MRHRKGNSKLSLPTDQRLALLRSQLRSVLLQGKINTTLHRARATARLVDRCIQLGKNPTLAQRRMIYDLVQDRDLVKKVCVDISPRFAAKSGGYARVLKMGKRLGDGAELALLTISEHRQTA